MSRYNGRESCAKRSKREQGRENGTQKSPGFNKNIKESGPLIMGERGLRLVLVLILYLF
jgi:hypothetical protein